MLLPVDLTSIMHITFSQQLIMPFCLRSCKLFRRHARKWKFSIIGQAESSVLSRCLKGLLTEFLGKENLEINYQFEWESNDFFYLFISIKIFKFKWLMFNLNFIRYNMENSIYNIYIKIISFVLWIVLFKVGIFESDNSDGSFFCTWDVSSTILEKVNRVNGAEMTTDLTNLASVHDVTHMSFETCLTTCHSCKNSLDTSTHDHVELWVAWVTKQWTDWNCVHWELLLEVSDDL